MAERFGVYVLLAVLLLAPPARSQPPNEVAAKLAAGVWAYRNSAGEVLPSGSFTGTPPDSALTASALAARQAFDFRSDDPVLGCGEPGMPRALTAGSPMTFAWFDGDLTIRYESMDVRRTVHMKSDAAPAMCAHRTATPWGTGKATSWS
jgi:hypothetical protein